MCLIFLAFNSHPSYKLILAGNRDEFYARKTAAAEFWQDEPNILAGRDLEAGGTWLGMNRSGKISMLTNYRDPQNINPLAPSRGQLVSDYLRTSIPPSAYLAQVVQDGKAYNGFNLITGTPDELWYYSNYREGIEQLEPGFYGISNHLLETPWPKVQRGKEKLKPILSHPTINPDHLFEALYDEQRAPDDKLPNTGLSLDREQALSSMFIKTENYGSRCSTVILIDRKNQVFFSERVYDLKTFQFTTQSYQFATGEGQ